MLLLESALPPLPISSSSSSPSSLSRSSSSSSRWGNYCPLFSLSVREIPRSIASCRHFITAVSSSSDAARTCYPSSWISTPRRSFRDFSRAYAVPERSDPSSPDHSFKPCYHPSEEIEDEELPCDTRLTDAETARTIIEVNSKATLISSGMVDEVHENIIWTDLPYLLDEHGDIYFELDDDQDSLNTLNAGDKLLQVIIGMDNIELNEMEVMEPSDFDFSFEETTSEDTDIDDEYEEDLVAILDDDEDEMISSETLGNWANLDTMRSSHPMYFANKIAEVVTDKHFDWMDQPSASIVIQGLLRPVFTEENAAVRKYPSGINTNNKNMHQIGKIVEHNNEEGLEKNQSLQGGTAFYKLEMINVTVISAYGNQSVVKVQDFRKAKPDVLAHSAADIISRLKAGGEKMLQAFKSLCWRQKGVQIEEAAISGVDSLGFDLRVCSGAQIQTLRFAFGTRASSEYSAERQIHDLLFPRFHHKQQMWPQANQKEC